MELFTWSDAFETRIETVDAQHRQLIDLINRLIALCMSTEDVRPCDLESARAAVLAYARVHFREEEEWMESIGCDPRHVEQHREAHHAFVHEVESLGACDREMSGRHLNYLLGFLTNWISYHVLSVDMSMARQCRAIQAGRHPAEAYDEDFQFMLESRADPLLKALSSLMHLFMRRNEELRETNRDLEARVRARTADLHATNRRLERLSTHDDLTGLPNRRFALAALDDAWERMCSAATPVSVLALDIDHFKPVNDQFGHAAGDDLLRHVGACLRKIVRGGDIVCRMGGDEFLIICPGTPEDGAALVARKILDGLSGSRAEGAQGWSGSLSIGVAQARPAMGGPDELLQCADEALYSAKACGRGCFVRHGDAPGPRSAG